VDNVKMKHVKIGWGGVDWIVLAQDKENWRALVNVVMNHRANYLVSWSVGLSVGRSVGRSVVFGEEYGSCEVRHYAVLSLFSNSNCIYTAVSQALYSHIGILEERKMFLLQRR
jgi:hypothetical protein